MYMCCLEKPNGGTLNRVLPRGVLFLFVPSQTWPRSKRRPVLFVQCFPCTQEGVVLPSSLQNIQSQACFGLHCAEDWWKVYNLTMHHCFLCERRVVHELHAYGEAQRVYREEASHHHFLLLLLLAFCSLVPSVLPFSWSEPPALWQKSASLSKGPADRLTWRQQLQWGGLWLVSPCIRNRQVVEEQHGGHVFDKPHAVIWVASDTFPHIPAASGPSSRCDPSLRAESLHLKIDAHFPQQHGSSSAR